MPLVKGTGKDVRILIFYVSIGCGNIMSKTLVVHLGYWYNYSNIVYFSHLKSGNPWKIRCKKISRGYYMKQKEQEAAHEIGRAHV